MTVTETSAMKPTIIGHIQGAAPVRSFTICSFSGKTPCMRSVFIAPGTVGKYVLPISRSFVSCLNATAKTYTIMTQSTINTATDLAAKPMPFMMITSSGTARRIFAILDKRSNLTILTIRNIDMPPSPPAVSSFMATSMMVIIQVSTTIIETRTKSNTNQASVKQLSFLRNAQNRTRSSKKKNEQNTFSAIWNIGSALMSTAASL
mmetsp:Transcript_74971/g.135027  ORF Transcript_74971/g.135027 Transcript_74971/m.135027 type:complete len:205 (-) Transcript_74971:365-979(-)